MDKAVLFVSHLGPESRPHMATDCRCPSSHATVPSPLVAVRYWCAKVTGVFSECWTWLLAPVGDRAESQDFVDESELTLPRLAAVQDLCETGSAR